MMIGDLRLVEDALLYLEEGYSVIPLRPGTKKPLIEWGEYQKRLPTKEEVGNWWKKRPDANIGIVCGKVSQLLALDVDTHQGVKIPDDWDLDSNPTPKVKTPRQGYHYWYRWPQDEDLPTKSFIRNGIEFRANGSLVVAPPSIVDYQDESSGKRVIGSYTWLLSPSDQPPADPPDCILNAMRSNAKVVSGPAPEIEEKIRDGTRNKTLASAAGRMRRRGFDESEILAALLVMNQKRCDPPLPDDEVKKIAGSISNYEPAEPLIEVLETIEDIQPETDIVIPDFNLDTCIPKVGVVPEFLDYVSSFTDASQQFSAITILQVISIAAGNKFWIDWAGQQLYLNLSTLRLGKSTYTRKTNTAWMTNSLLREIEKDNQWSYLLATECTSEGLIKALAAREEDGVPTSGFMIFSEMGHFLSSAGKGYNQGNEIFLADLHDCKPIRRQLAQREFTVERPVVNIIGCSTVEWIKEFVTRSTLKGGFWGRFIITVARMPTEDEITWWAATMPDLTKKDRIVGQLRKIADRSNGTALQFENGFKEHYEGWCRSMYQKYAANPSIETLEGASARSPFNCLKLAAIIELSKNPDAKTVSVESGIIACGFMDYVLECLESLLGTAFVNERERKRSLVRDFFLQVRDKKDKLVKRADFQSKFSKLGIDAYQLDQCLIDLESEGVLEITEKRQYSGRTTVSLVKVLGEAKC